MNFRQGVCGNHAGGQSLAHKALLQGYYWPTMKADVTLYAKKCDRCQRYSNLMKAPPTELTAIFCPWPFAKWGFDVIGPLPVGPGGVKFAIVAVDYFTKWVEAIALARITEQNVVKFLREHIIYRFGIPQSLVSDNALQFRGQIIMDLCEEFGISKDFSTTRHP